MKRSSSLFTGWSITLVVCALLAACGNVRQQKPADGGLERTDSASPAEHAADTGGTDAMAADTGASDAPSMGDTSGPPDAGSGDGATADAPKATGTKLTGGIWTTGVHGQPGSTRLVNEGFEFGARTCSASVCVTGGIVP